MHRDFGAYGEDRDVKVLALPYAGDRLAMMFVLPREDAADSLAAVEDGLDAAAVDRWAKLARQRRVDVSLPRFKLETPIMSLGGDPRRPRHGRRVLRRRRLLRDERARPGPAQDRRGLPPRPGRARRGRHQGRGRDRGRDGRGHVDPARSRRRRRPRSRPTTRSCSSCATPRAARSCSPGGSPTRADRGALSGSCAARSRAGAGSPGTTAPRCRRRPGRPRGSRR